MKRWMIALSLLALAAGLLFAQGPYDMQVSKSGHLLDGFGTALPVATDDFGRNPADGDKFTLLTAGAAANPVRYLYSNANAAWIPMSPIAGAANMPTTLVTNSVDVANSVWGGTSQLIFEGATADGFESILTTEDVGTDVIYALNAEVAGTYELLSTGGIDALGAAAATEIPPNDYAHVIGSKSQTKVWFRQGPLYVSVAPTTTAGYAACHATNLNYMTGAFMPYIMESDAKATLTVCAPTFEVAEGARMTTDVTDNDGFEWTFGITASSPAAFVAQTDPAFYARLRVTQETVAESDGFWFGFREAAAYADADLEDYEELCGIGYGDRADGADYEIATVTQIGNAGIARTSVTATNGVWADGETHTLEVQVTAAGVCTTYEDGVLAAAQPATTFTAADVVIPFFWVLNDATAAAQRIDFVYWEFGIQ